MKNLVFSMALVLSILLNLSCSEENKVSAWVGDGEEVDEGTIVFFYLEENYPNPFNLSTIFKYGIAFELHVDLDVYSDDWIKVATLVNEVKQPGVYEITFNAEGLSSGEYFYTMTVEGVTQIRKMKLVK